MKNFKYSWQQLAKVSFVGIATTATFYLTKTTGLFFSWLSTEELSSDVADSKESLSMSFPRIHGGDMRIHAGQRRLLQSTSGNITLANPIPDQVIQVEVPYQYSLDNVFLGNYTLLIAEQANHQPLPSWLSLQYKLSSVTNGYAYSVAVSGNTAYLADSAGLQIIDISNVNNPRIVSTINSTVNNYPIDVVVNGTIAFTAMRGAGLQIVDVSNINNPRIISTVPGAGATAVALSGNTVFMAVGFNLQIINVTNTSNPRVISMVTTSVADAINDIAVSGSIALIANLYAGLKIVDVSNVSNPYVVSTVPNSGIGAAYGVAVSGNTVYVADERAGLQIVDISNISNPRLLSTVANGVGGFAWGVGVSGKVAFVADGPAGLQVVDVSNASNPRIISNISMIASSAGGYAANVAISGSLVFVAVSVLGLQILDLSQASLIGTPPSTQIGQPLMLSVSARDYMMNSLNAPIFILTCDQLPRSSSSSLEDQSIFPGMPLNLPLQSTLLFTNPRNSFLQLSVLLTNGQSTPEWLKVSLTPVTLSTLFNSPGSQVSDVVVRDSMAFVANGYAGLKIVNVGNVGNPYLVSTALNQTGTICAVAISGNTVFVADNSGGKLYIVDVSNVANPRNVSTFLTSGYAQDVAVSGNTVFVADYTAGLQIMDVSNLSNPRLLSTVVNNASGQGALGVALSDRTVFVADGGTGLQIIDVSNTSNPRILSTVPNSAGGQARGVAVSGNTVFIADFTAGLQIIDVTNASNPGILSTVPNAAFGNAMNVAVSGNIIFVADGSGGLQIIDASNTSSPRIISTITNSVGVALGVTVSGNTVFLADGSAGLQIIDISQWRLTAMPSVVDAGNYRVQVTATDDLGGIAVTQPFTIRVEGPPQFHGNISTQLAKIGQAFNYFVSQGLVTDPNFDSLVFTAKLNNGQPLPSWLNFNGLSATFAGTPPSSAVGNMTIVLSVTDNIAGSVNTTFVVTINHIPIVNQRIADQLMGIGQNNSFAVPAGTFTHPDNLPLVYLAQRSNGLSLPAWLLFNNISRIFTGQPNATDVGIVSVQVSVVDSLGGQADTVFTLHVDNFPRISQPILTSSASINADYRFSVANSFVDDDGDVMSYQASLSDGSLLPVWLSFNAYSLEFFGTPTTSDLEAIVIRFSATDSWGGRTDQLFNLSVVSPPGVGVAISQQVACVDQSYRFVVPGNAFVGGAGFGYSARQGDGQLLPLWLNLDGVTGAFSGTPTSTDADQITITLLCGGASTDFNLVVAAVCPTLRNPIVPRITNVNAPFALTLAGDTFDNGGMALTLSAQRADQSPLPSWLSFNPSSGVLAGVPLDTNVGVQALQFIAQNPLGGQGIAPFNLTVCYFPSLATALPTVPPLRTQRAFAFTILPGTFTSQSGGALQYQVQQADGSALPSWLTFNASQLTLLGMPGLTDLGAFNLQILVSEGACGPTIAPLSLVVQQNYPPEVAHPLTNQIASVDVHFTFYAPSDTFTDKNSDVLTYTAMQSNGHPLPGWLKFAANTLSFSGTPGRGDTGNFGDKVLTIALTARDDKSQTSANFNISVTGTSHLLLFIKIAVPIFSVLTTAIALYLKRGRLLNHCKSQRYQRLEDCKVSVGEEFKYQFETPKEQIVAVRVRIPKENKGCCRMFQLPRQALPGGTDLPIWMEYDPETNILHSKGPVPNGNLKEMFVQVKGSADRTLEQFTLRIEQPALSEEAIEQQQPGPSLKAEADGSGDVEMQTLQSTAPRVSF